MGTLPIDRVRLAWLRFFRGIPDGEAAPCKYCGVPVAAHMGVRDVGGVFCSDECGRLDFERIA